MYLYQPCLLTLSLYAWAFDNERGRWLRIGTPLFLLFLSEWALSYARIEIYSAALLLPVMYGMGRVRCIAWAEALTASLLGGLICWKVWDAWPLFGGIQLLCGVILLIPALLLCRSREDRLLACTLGSLLFEMFVCLREYMLFSYCVVRLGSKASLSLGAASLCLYALGEQAFDAYVRRKDIPVSLEIE